MGEIPVSTTERLRGAPYRSGGRSTKFPNLKIRTCLKTEFILGMAKRDGKFIMLPDVDKVFSTDELSLVQEAGEARAQAG